MVKLVVIFIIIIIINRYSSTAFYIRYGQFVIIEIFLQPLPAI